MSVQPVRLFTDSILHKRVDLITDFTGLDIIASDLVETMLEYNGIGLAANQVGLDKNIAVLYLENKTKIIVVVNLKIMCYNKEKNNLTESCLSVPGMIVPIERFTEVDFEYQDLQGQKQFMKLKDFDARILQHEHDHLYGKLIIDNLKL